MPETSCLLPLTHDISFTLSISNEKTFCFAVSNWFSLKKLFNISSNGHLQKSIILLKKKSQNKSVVATYSTKVWKTILKINFMINMPIME